MFAKFASFAAIAASTLLVGSATPLVAHSPAPEPAACCGSGGGGACCPTGPCCGAEKKAASCCPVGPCCTPGAACCAR